MPQKDFLSKLLAVSGTIFAGLPLVAPAAFALIRWIQAGRFLFDFLMPAELFPAVLLGGCLLLWAAGRMHLHRRLIGWSLGLMVGLLLAAMGLAEVTGLASGATEPAGWPWALVIAAFTGFWAALVALAAGGVLLLRILFGIPRRP